MNETNWCSMGILTNMRISRSLPETEHHDASLRRSHSIGVVKESKVLVAPKIATMNGAAETQFLESQRNWLRHVVGHKIEHSHRLCTIGQRPDPSLKWA